MSVGLGWVVGTLAQAKLIGGIGSILALLAAAPQVGWILSIVGWILVLVAIKYVSDALANPRIFKDALMAVMLNIIGVVVAIVVGIAVGLGAFFALAPDPSRVLARPFVFIWAIITALLALWAFLLASAVFLRRSYNTMAAGLGVGLFGTAGLLYLIGAGLTIVLVGLIIIFIALILQTIAFFSIPEQPPKVASEQVTAQG